VYTEGVQVNRKAIFHRLNFNHNSKQPTRAVARGIGPVATAQPDPEGDAMRELKTRLLYEAHVEVAAPIDVGQTPEAHRYIVNITGGWIKGPKISGKILNNGADWIRLRSDGSLLLDIRALVETDDGALIYVAYGGKVRAPVDLLPKIFDFANAHQIDPSQYYFRTQPLFETASPKYAWLNDAVCVGVGTLGHGGVQFSVYEVL